MVCSSLGKRSGATPSAAIAGGFVLVPVHALLHAWRACRAAPLGVGDFRAWLAAREMVARRARLGDAREPNYTVAELAALLGVSTRRAAAAARRLGTAGLLTWSPSAIVFHEHAPSGDDFVLDAIGRGRGDLAVPRRILRLLAGGARPALIATALGLLLRCLSRRRCGFDGRGRLKAAWVASLFGVDLRRVKHARLELVDSGWIEPLPDRQWAMNRWGRAYRIRLDWGRAGTAPGRRSPPPVGPDGTQSPPPAPDREPLREEEDQEPARGGPPGVQHRGKGRPGPELSAPNLDDVRSEDLRDAGRALELHEQAAARGLIGRSEADRLRFLAAAEHARAVGTRNPGGLLARLVRRGWWHFATQGDEDAAARRLKEHLHGRAVPPGRSAAPRGSVVLDGPAVGPVPLGGILGGLLGGSLVGSRAGTT